MTPATLAAERPAPASGPPALPDTLSHYTCVSSGARIRRGRVIEPRRHLLLGASLVWLSDLYPPDRYALGLTSHWITCDRTAVRVRVHPGPDIVPWGRWAHEHRVPRVIRELLEDGAMPAHWFVSAVPVPVATVHMPPQPPQEHRHG